MEAEMAYRALPRTQETPVAMGIVSLLQDHHCCKPSYVLSQFDFGK